MSKQDRQGVRTPSDLERKYDFGQLSGANSHKLQTEKLNQLTQTISQFMTNVMSELSELKKSTNTWFCNGVPTLENMPAAEWDTDELKAEHIGNLCFDEDNNVLYLFKRTGELYEWVQC